VIEQGSATRSGPARHRRCAEVPEVLTVYGMVRTTGAQSRLDECEGSTYYLFMLLDRLGFFNRFKIAAVFIASGILPLGAATYNCTVFSIPGSKSLLTGINNAGFMTGSYSAVSNGTLTGPRHGFVRDAAGNTVTFDYPNSTGTQLFTINNNGRISGQFTNGNTTGFFTLQLTFPLSGGWALGAATPVTLPPPYDSATSTFIYGINDSGALSGVATVPNAPPAFFILNPDGTVTAVPGYDGQSRNSPGALNNALQMFESDLTFGEAAVAGADGTLTPIVFPSVNQRVYGNGLNNAGTVAGYFSRDPNGSFHPPFVGFSRDSSGVYGEIICPGVPVSAVTPSYLPTAINDSGIVVGGGIIAAATNGPAITNFIATPQPGLAQLTMSTNSLTFPSTPAGQTSAAQNVTIANAGNARLDIALISAFGNPTFSISSFGVSGCVDAVTGIASLDPGASCTLAVTAKPVATGQFTGSVIIDDSATGAPHSIALAVTGTPSGPPLPPPSCQLTGVIGGPPKQLQITMQDRNSGLNTIQVTSAVNVTVNVPAFGVGTISPIVVTATKVDQSQSSEVGFTVTNVEGSATSCDPVDFTASIRNHTETHKFRNLSSSEHYIRIINGKPGLEKIVFRVNEDQFDLSGLPAGASRDLNIGSAMRTGNDNRVELRASGAAGASAYILIGDSSIR
jgi:hypothetical protein